MHGHEFKLTLNIPFIDFDILSSLKQLQKNVKCNDENEAVGVFEAD